MRDIIVSLVVFGALPVIIMRPYVGIYLWSWIGYMAPHRLGWGFAYNFPFAMIIGVVTLIALLFSKEPKRIPLTPVTVCLILLLVWMGITTVFAIDPAAASGLYKKVLKIQLIIFATLVLITTRKRIQYLVWVIAASLGFYGIKGGLFAIRTGGQSQVVGPPGTFLTGNTEIGLALVMTLPLMYYLFTSTGEKWVKRGLLMAMGLTLVAIIATYSRGALLGVVAMGSFLLLKSRHKLLISLLLLLCIPVAVTFMPDRWSGRMQSIETYKEDNSAMGRVLAWRFAYDMASSRFLGGGFVSFTPQNYHRFSPNLEVFNERYQGAHSIYFQMLGHHGFVGLGLFLLFLLFAWRTGGWIIRHTRDRPEIAWAGNLAAMVQVSMVGYAVSGAFLGVAYFDLIYHLVAILVVTKIFVEGELQRISGDVEKTTRFSPLAADHKVLE